MAELVAYPARFSFGRLFADAWRVFARAGWRIFLGTIVLGAVPVSLTAMPWWNRGPETSVETFERIRVGITLAKVVFDLIAYAATTAFVTASCLTVLTGMSWGEGLSRSALLAPSRHRSA